jgi:hypothetical protein
MRPSVSLAQEISGVLRHACPELAEGLSTNGGKLLSGNIPFALSLSKGSELMF